VLIPRLEVNQSLFKGKVRLNATMMGRQQKYFSGLGIDVYRNALGYNPTDPLKDENGVWTEHPGINNYANPVALLNETGGETVNNSLKTFGSVTFTPIDDLMMKLNVSHGTNNFMNGYSETKKHIFTIRDSRNGVASRETNKSVDDFIELFAQYKKSFGAHNITALLGHSWQNNQFESFYMYNFDFPSDQYSYNNMATGQALQRGEAQMRSYKQQTSLIGYFSRINYNYKNRYLLMASIRREASSKFGKDYKWGNFPAFSLGWNLRGEQFMKGQKTLSTAKIRAGFGVTGTEPTDPYMSQSRLGYGSSYLLNGVWTPVILPLTNSNPELRWERKEEVNVGVDFGFLNDRLFGSVDIYKRTTKGLLWDYNVPMPPYLYPTITANAGVMQNKGIEVQIRAIPIEGNDLRWISTVNFSTNRNKLVSLSNDKFVVQGGYFNTGYIGEPIQETTHRIQQGGEIGNFWAYESVDIDENGYWIISGQDGNRKPVAQASPNDQHVIGNGLPKYYASLNNSLRYKHFDLDVNMRGAFDFEIINYARLFYEAPVNLARGNILRSTYRNAYGRRPLNDLADYKFVSYYVEKGDYLKIDNVTIGYNFTPPGSFVKQLRVFLSGQNLFVITKYSGIDPEVNISGLAPGADDRDRYPSTRSFAAGVNLNF
jgi:TonB-linked SusC/RagA family outer membrane protein